MTQGDTPSPVNHSLGEEKVSALLESYPQASADDLVEDILGVVRQHAGDCPQADDMTLVVIRRQKS